MSLRVISGSAKGRKLKRVPGDTTRPITDRVKENLFNLLGPDYVEGTRWLDLFAGTGSVGIEALSRGATHVTFVDAARLAIRTIDQNLKMTQLDDQALLRHGDAFQFIERNAEPYDVIYVAPPQYHGIWVGVLAGIGEHLERVLLPDGIVIVQIDPKEFIELSLDSLALYKQRTYGNTMLAFYERQGSTPI